MKRVPTYWWDFVWYTLEKEAKAAREDFFIIVESERTDGVDCITCNNIIEAEKIIADLNAGRMTWPKS